MSTDRMDSTIGLRMRHVRALAREGELRTITVERIEELMAFYRHLAPETRKSALASMRVFFTWAVARGIRPDDPTETLGSIRVRTRMPHLAPDDDVRCAAERAEPRERAMILLARFGCLRLSEVTTLHTADRQGDVLTVRGKGDKERLVYLNPDLLEALVILELAQGPGWYFPGGTPAGHLHPVSVNKIITRLTGHNPHSLRHAGATAAYRATRDLRAVQEMLGHASLSTTERYLHLDDDARRRVAAGTGFARREMIAA